MKQAGASARISSAWGIALAAILGVASTFVAIAPAQAVQSPQDLVVSANPADFTPHVLDGEVKAIAVVGDTVVLGGDFTRVQDDVGGPILLDHPYIVAFNRTTGLIVESFAPVVDDVVRTLAPAPDGQSVYLGGKFGAINGTPAYKVARLGITDGLPVAGFDAGVVDAIVYDLKLVDDRLFIAGQFTHVQGQDRSLLAELDPATGALRSSSWPVFAGVHGVTPNGVTHLEKIDINPDGATLVAIGNYATVGGQPRVEAAMLDITGTPAVTNWRTTRFETLCKDGFDSITTDIDYSPDGAYFVISTTGGYGAPNALCDTVTKWSADRRGQTIGPIWAAYTGGDSTYAVAVTGAAIYAGGHMEYMNNPYGADTPGPGAVAREGLTALDPVTGLPLRWNPTRDRGRGVFDMVATPDGLWVGSDTDRIGNFEYHGRIAFFPLSGGTSVPHPVAPSLPVVAYIASAAPSFSSLAFDGDVPGPVTETMIAGVDPTTITGGFWLDGRLYLASTDGTLTARAYDGKYVGATTTVDLHGLTDFADELTRMTGLFYNDGNLIFTLAGETSLYRRAFTSESGVVGAQRFTVPAAGVNWSKIQGMFYADGGLFAARKATGDLFRITFGPNGPVAGTGKRVSGPNLDGQDWRGNAIFTLTPRVPQAPSAAFTVGCAGPVCNFDAAQSADADGVITDYAWDFGDGSAPATGAQVEHTYSGPGTYDVTLTVTDDESLTGTTLNQATVVASAIEFVGSARHAIDTTSGQQTVTLPTGIQSGDQLVMTMSHNSGTATVTDPEGWTRVASASTMSMSTFVWTRTAQTGDANSVVTVRLSVALRSDLLVSAYRNAVVPAANVVLVGETVSRAEHTTPPATVVKDGSFVISSWSDKTAATASWTEPLGETVLQTGTQAGTRISWLLTQTGPVAAGEVGGKTAVANAASGPSATANATMATIVVSPSQ